MPAARPDVVVLDYGSGNLRSAERALVAAGADAVVTDDVARAASADGLVVPGVGAYAACMAGLRAVRGDKVVGERLAAARPVLGICVGMQVLFDGGHEHGVDTDGCAQLAGRIERLGATVLPHMGWNTVDAQEGSPLFAGVGGERFYFLHSYAARRDPGAGTAVTWAEHGERFVAAVEAGPLSATQFHPEKSGAVGVRLLANWLETL